VDSQELITKLKPNYQGTWAAPTAKRLAIITTRVLGAIEVEKIFSTTSVSALGDSDHKSGK
jgi:hypothetical protein